MPSETDPKPAEQPETPKPEVAKPEAKDTKRIPASELRRTVVENIEKADEADPAN